MTLEENCSWKTHISGTHENIKNSKTNNESAMISRSKIEGKLLIKHGSDNLKSTFKNEMMALRPGTVHQIVLKIVKAFLQQKN